MFASFIPCPFTSCLFVFAILQICAESSLLLAGEPFVFRHESVLGTSLVLRFDAGSGQAAASAESAALAEIDRLSSVLSTYDSTSELSRWQSQAGFGSVSPDLWNVLTASDRWQEATKSAFHPGTEALTQMWKRAEAKREMPKDDALWGVVVDLKSAPWELKIDTREARRTSKYPLTLNALAKGYIADQAASKALAVKGITSAVVNIGGDLRISGALTHHVHIRNPLASADNDPPLTTVAVKDKGVATSGGYFRGFTIQGREYSHILDPRTGKPSSRVASATVVADTTMDADALATAFSVLPPIESLAIAKTMKNLECLLVEPDGKQHISSGWNSLVATVPVHGLLADFSGTPSKNKPQASATSKTQWNGGFELKIDFEIAPVESVRYRRPYLAIWVEDSDSYPVNTLILWVQSIGAGPRWIPDLRRWYRSDRMRKLGEDTELVGTISEATRKPGKYEVIWDGRDLHDKFVPTGEYTILIEAAREHGTYQLIRRKVQFAEQPFQLKLPGNEEIKSVDIEYCRRK